MPNPSTPAGTGTPTSDQTAATRAATAPTTGQGSATELRTERQNVQSQLDQLQSTIAARQQSDPENGATNAEINEITGLNTRIATLTQQITAAESRAPAVIAGGSPTDQFIIRQNPNGTVDTQPNPNWDHQTVKAQTATVGNKLLNVAPDGTVTVAYTNQDAENLANAQTAVAQSNAKTAELAQQTNDYATRAKVDLDQRVANGEDAASVRAEQAQKLAELHEQWVESDGQAQRDQQALRDYNVERHTTAADQLGQDQLAATKAAQAQQDATTRRGQDLQSQQAAAATRASLANARLSAGTGYLGNTLSTLAQMNRDAPPNSAAVGNMLVPLMNLGQQFFSNLGGLGSPNDILNGGASTVPTSVPNAAGGLTPPAVAPTDATTQPISTVTPPAPQVPTTPVDTTGAPMPDWYTAWQQRQEADRAQQQAAASAALQANAPLNTREGGIFAHFASGGIVTKPTLGVVGEAGPEAIIPLSPGAPGGAPPAAPLPVPQAAAPAPAASPLSPAGGGGLPAVQAFLAGLEQLLSVGQSQANTAAQGAAALGHPPEAAANPMIPGSAVPGIPPAAAAQQAMARPLAPDGSPYASPQDVMARLAARRGGPAGPTPASGPPTPVLAGAGG